MGGRAPVPDAAALTMRLEESHAGQTAAGGFVADELGNLAMLHDEEKISDQEYEQAKAKIVS